MLPPPVAYPAAAGACGRQRVNAARSLPPPRPPARLPSARLCRPSRELRLPRAPQVATITCKSSGARAPRGSAYSCRGPVPQLQVDPLLHIHVPSSPLFKLNFPRRGRRGERRPGLRGEGRRKGLLEAAAGCAVPGSVRASGAPGAKLLAGAERNHGGKRGLESCACLTTAAPGRGHALRLNRRRGAAAARLHSAPRGAARLGGGDCGGAGRRRGRRSPAAAPLPPPHVGRLM